jgi:hypothetical protein
VLALAAAAPLAATNLTGTFKHPDGSPVNGKLIFLLSQPARLNDQTAQIVPMVKIFSVTNGQLEAGAFLYGNDVMTPAGTYYLVRLVDANNNLLFEQKWSIQGANLDLSTLTPTTTGVVLPDPLIKNVTTDQIVQGPVSFNAPLSVFSLSIDGNVVPGTSQTNSLGNPTRLWRDFYALQWDALYTVGAVGSVVVPPSAPPVVAVESASGGSIAAGTYYCVLTYGNRNGETPASPQGSVTTSGSTSQIKLTPADYHWLTGAYKMRVYCGNVNGGPYYLQTPTSWTRTIAAAGGSIARTSNVVTVTTTATHGFAPADTITISGVDDSSFNGTFTVKDVLTSTQFTYDQTAGNASSQNGTVTFSTAIDTNWHYADTTGGIILSSITLSGSQPPSSNTATIDPLQVAVNSARLGTDTANNVQTRLGKVLLGGTNYTLTTPLVLAWGDVVEGAKNELDVSQIGLSVARPRINCAWTDARSGCVMIMSRNVSLKNLSVNATTATNAIFYFGVGGDTNSQYLGGVFASVPISSTGVAAIRVYGIKEAHDWHWNHLTVNGGRYAVLFSHTFLRGLTWWEGRCNLGATTPAGSSCAVQGSGWTDVDRGVNGSGGLSGYVDARLYRVTVESARGRAFDWKGGYLKLGDGTENADSQTDAGTDALVYLDSNASSSGNVYTGFVLEDSILHWHANAAATVKFGPGANDYLFMSCRNSTVYGSGASSVSLDMNSLGRWDSFGCRYPDANLAATLNKIINAPSPFAVRAVGWNHGQNNVSGVFKHSSPYFVGPTSGSKCWDFDSAGGGVQDDLVLRDNDCTAEIARFKSTTAGKQGDFWARRLLRYQTGGGGNPTTYFEFAGTPTGARVLTFQDSSDTIVGRATTDTLTNKTLTSPTINSGALSGTFSGTPTISGQWTSTVTTGTAPLVIASTTEVANLNVERWRGKTSVDFSAALDFGSIAAQTCAELTISATGAATDSPVAPGWPAALEAGLTGIMRVSSADTITVRLCNVTAAAIDPASRTFSGRVIK